MTANLYVLHEENVPVEEIEPGMRLVSPAGRRVTVERVDEYEDDSFMVRWWRRAEQGEPGHRGGKQHADAIGYEWDGRYLGSFPKQPGETVRIARG